MITIIIPAHNEKNNLEYLISKLESMTRVSPVEVIVTLSCDNSDASENLSASDMVRFLKCSQKGRAVQMNAAVQKSKGSILVFLHADVVPPQTFLSDVLNTIQSDYDAGFFSYKFDKESFLLKVNASFTASDGIFTGGGDQCLFIKKDVFLDLDGFDEEQILMEDFEFFDRMKRNKVRYKIVKNDLIVSARKYENNSYARVNLSNLLLLVLFRFGYPAPKLKALHHRLLRSSY